LEFVVAEAGDFLRRSNRLVFADVGSAGNGARRSDDAGKDSEGECFDSFS